MDDERPGRPHRCRATAKTTGQPCKNNPGPGALVCWAHGGKAPQVARKAAERAREDRARDACDALGLPVTTTPEAALQDELNRAYGHVLWFRRRVAGLGDAAFAWGDAEPAWWQVYREERGHLVTVCKTMLAADVQDRLLGVAKETAAQFHAALSGIADALNLTGAQRAMLPEVVPRVLSLITVPDGDDGDGPRDLRGPVELDASSRETPELSLASRPRHQAPDRVRG